MLPDINKLLQPRPRKYRNLVKHLSNYLLTTESTDLDYTETDVFQDLTTSRGTNRFLGVFSQRGIEFGLNQFGVMEALEKMGLPNYRLVVDTTDSFKHRLQMKHHIDGKSYLSGEIVIRRGSFALPNYYVPETPSFDFVIVEWFLLQHPLKPFSRWRPQLPGQKYPGLGISELVFEILYWVARRLKAAGVLMVPNYLHTGLFYGRQLLFPDPVRQGHLYVLSRLVPRKVRLDQLTWACTEGQLINQREKSAYLWEPAPMVLPVSKALKDHFHSAYYVQTVREERNKFKVAINPGYRKEYNSSWLAK